jgi:hypothetical protein
MHYGLTAHSSNCDYLAVCEISGSHGRDYEYESFWDVAPCSLVQVHRRFRGAQCLHHQGGESSQKVVIFTPVYLWVYRRVNF